MLDMVSVKLWVTSFLLQSKSHNHLVEEYIFSFKPTFVKTTEMIVKKVNTFFFSVDFGK